MKPDVRINMVKSIWCCYKANSFTIWHLLNHLLCVMNVYSLQLHVFKSRLLVPEFSCSPWILSVVLLLLNVPAVKNDCCSEKYNSGIRQQKYQNIENIKLIFFLFKVGFPNFRKCSSFRWKYKFYAKFSEF